jgi:hypothetical protein
MPHAGRNRREAVLKVKAEHDARDAINAGSSDPALY